MEWIFIFVMLNMKFNDLIMKIAPIHKKVSKKLISSDVKNNTQFFQSSFSLEIIPICKDDLILLPMKFPIKFNGFLLVDRITTIISLIDPFTLQSFEFNSDKFFKNSFLSIL